RLSAMCLGLILLGFFAGALSTADATSIEPANIKSGNVGRFRWRALVSGSLSPNTPCIRVELRKRSGPPDPLAGLLVEESCRTASPFPNSIGLTVQGEGPTSTVVGMAFPPNVAAVSVYFKRGLSDRTIPTRAIPRDELRGSHLRPFQYA